MLRQFTSVGKVLAMSSERKIVGVKKSTYDSMRHQRMEVSTSSFLEILAQLCWEHVSGIKFRWSLSLWVFLDFHGDLYGI